MKTINKIWMALAMAVAFVAVQAQEASPVDFMRYNPYQMNANPATDLPYSSVMSLVIGNIGLDIQNTTLRFDNCFDFDAQGRPAAINLRQLANSLKEDNYLGFDAHLDLFTLYKRLKKGMLTINYGLKAQGNARFNDGLFQLLGYGNSAFVGEDHPAQVNMDINAMGYQELAVGYQWNVTEQLSLGGKAKLLFGVANVKTDAFDAQLYTDPDSYALRLKEKIAMKAALPNVIYVDETGHLKTDGPFSMGELFRNPGFGVDLAAEYRFNEQFSAVAAVRDLGFIHWGKNNIAMTGQVNDMGEFYDNGDFLFDGLSVDEVQRILSDDYYREHFLDTLQRYFQVGFSPMDKYTTALNTSLLLRGNYDLDARNRFSAQVQGRFLGSGFRPALTLAYCGSFWNNFNVCATYTMMPHSYDNIGLGVSAMIETCNIYLTTNNLIGLFRPLNMSGFNAQVGIVFNLWIPERRYVDESGKPEFLDDNG
ncbi:MAG: hypothetical protein II829_07160 [Bacteroidales bacterium]|nr:hypothetical protein [Bacteroidales bacterium]